MNTFIKNQYYDDALDLLSYMKRISKKHFIAEIPIIKSIIEEVKESSKLLLDQLLSQLRSTVQLPVCLRVVGYLRRLESFTEVELRIKFIQLRNTWFESKLEMLPNDLIKTNSYEYITQIIEIYRVHLFDIVTQYRAIFSDDTSFQNFGRDALSTDDLPQESSIFSCWLSYRISCFLDDLEVSLQSVDARFDFILGQCMYFGQSFSRVGCDFRCLLIPIFQDAIENFYSKAIEQVDSEFQSNMMTYAPPSTKAFSKDLVAETPLASNTPSVSPPIELLEYYPLSVYLNGLLTIFNLIRVCCPTSVALWLPIKLDKSSENSSSVIATYYNIEEPAFSSENSKAFQLYCRAFLNKVFPHINTCCSVLLSKSHMLNSLECPLVLTGTKDHLKKVTLLIDDE